MSLLIKDFTAKTQEDTPLSVQLSNFLGINPDEILSVTVLKKSLDARKKNNIVYHYQLEFEVTNENALLQTYPGKLEKSPTAVTAHPLDQLKGLRPRFDLPPIIIGSGPAGQAAALVLAEAGIPGILIERGAPVERRIKDVGILRRSGILNEESNYCYGEGGAGTFSDGKLTCGRKHPLIRYLFETWVKFGAPAEILYDAHPHIGTDYLIRMTKNIRTFLEERGFQIHFQTRLEKIEPLSKSRIRVHLSDGSYLDTEHLILATGHSARETYRMLWEQGVAMQPKPFAMGVRVEHPQDLIDEIQYGVCHSDLGVPAAEYKLTAQAGTRGIWTFCMCPGGHLLPTGAEAGHLSINGMSYHKRNSGFANAALVVSILREDYYRSHVLDGMNFQARLEQEAYAMGGGGFNCPAQRLNDFLHSRDSRGEMKSTYEPAVVPGRLDRLLPPYVSESLQSALADYNKRMRGFISDQAIIVGLESKTSAPVVIQRDKDFQSISHPGLYPTGEGAGFAGGIVSAALDGLRVGLAIMQNASSSSS